MFNYSFFIGCDVSKAFIDYSYWHNGEAIYLGQFKNNDDGFFSLVKSLRSITKISLDQWFFCFENTGSYSKPLLNWLHENSISFIEENPLQVSRSLGIRRGKTDKIDSLDLCRYAFEKRDTIQSTKPTSSAITRLKKLLSRRDFLVRQQSAMKVSLKEQRNYMEIELYEELEVGNQKLLKEYNSQIKFIENKIKELLTQDESISENYKLVSSIIGIGLITSAYLLATTNNFQSFTDARKYACYCGIAPFSNSSGIRKGRMRVSKMGNMKVKSLLSNCILSAIKHDPQIAMYHARKKEAGKMPGKVLNAIKNKLIHRVFAVVKRGTPYVRLNTYA